MITDKNYTGKMYRLVRDADGSPVMRNVWMKSSRGEEYQITGGRAPHKEGSTGRVFCGLNREFFPSVFDCHWEPLP